MNNGAVVWVGEDKLSPRKVFHLSSLLDESPSVRLSAYQGLFTVREAQLNPH